MPASGHGSTELVRRLCVRAGASHELSGPDRRRAGDFSRLAALPSTISACHSRLVFFLCLGGVDLDDNGEFVPWAIRIDTVIREALLPH
jgi:hypothetical protein